MSELTGYIKESIERSKLEYIGVTLNDESKKLLEELFNKYNPWKDQNIKIICHHMTVAHKTNINDDLYKWSLVNTNKEYNLTVTHYGWSNKAFAVKVETNVPSANENKHVTCAINIDKKGKPVDSNYINNWKKIDDNIILTGFVKPNYKIK